eukprot:1194324-Prorocentrum_minimum.AAC.8
MHSTPHFSFTHHDALGALQTVLGAVVADARGEVDEVAQLGAHLGGLVHLEHGAVQQQGGEVERPEPGAGQLVNVSGGGRVSHVALPRPEPLRDIGTVARDVGQVSRSGSSECVRGRVGAMRAPCGGDLDSH